MKQLLLKDLISEALRKLESIVRLHNELHLYCPSDTNTHLVIDTGAIKINISQPLILSPRYKLLAPSQTRCECWVNARPASVLINAVVPNAPGQSGSFKTAR